jgi:hypothetical protein
MGDGSGHCDGGEVGGRGAVGAGSGGGSGLVPYRRGRLTFLLLADETEVRNALPCDVADSLGLKGRTKTCHSIQPTSRTIIPVP